ncbi:MULTISPECIES: hypothetical protein [unclassified Chitinophaga]|uniref:hypothetical protein n=1 Tax=unclassified Chitinophaga TaxID=2619133 RepID=UPI00301055E1
MKCSFSRRSVIRQIGLQIALRCVCVMPLLAQSADSKITPPRPVPPSPEVASLFKFSELPVTLYTGLPNVSISMFEIKLKDLTIPVTLQYHTGGVKIDEVASTVGMNWNLSAGGSVNAMIRGHDDLSNGYPGYLPITDQIYAGHGQYDINQPEGGVSFLWCRDIAAGLSDPEPDMFNFNAPGISGKFFLGLEGAAHVVPVQPVKVKLYDGDGIKIVGEKGVVYYFNKREISYATMAGSANDNYYLTRIITPSRDTVDYVYEASNYTYKSYFGESRVKFISGVNSPELLAQAGDVIAHLNSYDSIRVTGWRIKAINCTNGTNVNFSYLTTSRKDLPGTNALKDISLYYKTGFIKKFVLKQEYRGDSTRPDLCRLWLSEVYEEGKNGMKVAPYKFFYDPSALPPRLSNGQDHWGYANSGGGSTRLPKNDIYWPLDPVSANREQDTSKSKAGIMTRLQYPTGGSTDFTYEPNDVWVENEQTITYSAVTEGVYGTPFTRRERTFTIPPGTQSKKIFYNTYASPPSTGGGGGGIEDPPGEDEGTCNITVIRPNGLPPLDYLGSNSNPNGEAVNWGPGQYTVVVDTYGDNSRSFFELKYEKYDTSYYTGNKIVGGWRIKKLAYKDPFTPAGDKVYNYSYTIPDLVPSHSSGTLPTSKPQYEYLRNLTLRKIIQGTGEFSGPEIIEQSCLVAVQSANSLLPLWNDHGHIFYPSVTVYNGDNGANGKTVYNFSYAANVGGYYGYPFAPSSNFDWLCGSLLKQDDFVKKNDGTYKLLQTTENKYGVGPDSVYWRLMYNVPEPPAHLKGIGVTVREIVPEMSTGVTVKPPRFDFNDYHYISAWLHLDSSVVTQFSPSSADQLKTTTSYKYKNGLSLQPTEVKMVNSKNEQVSTLNTYPNDYKGTAVYDTMVARNVITPVIQQTQFNNTGNKILLRKQTNYTRTSADILAPSSVQQALYTNNLDTEIVYAKYDENGNLLEYYAKDGVVHSFIWGYNNNYPVAEITGCDYTKALSYIRPALLKDPVEQQLRDELNLIRTKLLAESVMVTTYTYAPMIGITSVTDPTGKTSYYQYDDLNRLKVILDQNGKILKQYDYQYQKLGSQ